MNILKDFKKLFGLFNKREKVNSAILMGLILVGGVVETLGIGVILPFTTVLLDQDSAGKYPILEAVSEIRWIGGYRRFIVLMCFGLVLIFVLKSLYMFFLIYIQNRFTLNRQVAMSKKLLESYMYKPYEFFFHKNTAEMQRNVNTLVANVIQGMLMAGLSLLTELMIVACISILLLIIDPITTVCIMLALGGVSVLFYSLLRNKLDSAARRQNIFGTGMFKSVNEGLGSIKDIKVLGREGSFLARFESSGRGYAKTTAQYNLINQSPRLLIETIAVSGLVIIVVINALRNPDMNASLPTIALFGMAAIRIMPSVNRILGYATSIRFNMVHFNHIYGDLKEAGANIAVAGGSGAGGAVAGGSEVGGAAGFGHGGVEKINFSDRIEIRGLTYRYPGTDKTILENVNMTVEKGQAVGIVGSSGSGKTTLIDILLGLLVPEQGEIQVDGKGIKNREAGFRQNIGYVPQSVFIIDDTVAANVAFGVPEEEIDTNRVWAALGTANLKEFVESLEEGLDATVGERGLRLSGGQLQRLGIARALYGNPEILVLDEATSSLDTESERVITEAITKIGHTKTMIIIAHRLNTLEKCDVIYEVKDKGILRKAVL